MKEKPKEGFIVWILKVFLVAIPVFLAEKVLNGVQEISDARLRVGVYVLITFTIAGLLFILKCLGGVFIHS